MLLKGFIGEAKNMRDKGRIERTIKKYYSPVAVQNTAYLRNLMFRNTPNKHLIILRQIEDIMKYCWTQCRMLFNELYWSNLVTRRDLTADRTETKLSLSSVVYSYASLRTTVLVRSRK